MPANQTLSTNKTAHIITGPGGKTGSVTVGTVSSSRATTIVSTAQRKRDTGKLKKNFSFNKNQKQYSKF